jgi:hypothetical protein
VTESGFFHISEILARPIFPGKILHGVALTGAGRTTIHKYSIAETSPQGKRLLGHLAEKCTTGPNSFARALDFHGKGRPPALDNGVKHPGQRWFPHFWAKISRFFPLNRV